MSIHVRPADLRADSSALIELLRRHLSPEFDSERFQWLYQDGAYGPARVWVAVEGNTDRIVGSAAAYPRRIYFDGQVKSGFVLGDFCVDERYRSLGPSLQLQRACLTALGEPSFEFLYDFPSRSMMAIYKRLGINPCGELFRWVKPLRVEQRLRRVVRSAHLARAVGLLANPLLAHRGWQGDKKTCDLQLHEGPLGEEFSQLDGRLRNQAGVHTERSSDFLNWRYRGNPRARYDVLSARRGGKLVGYVVSTHDVADASVVDLGSVEEPGIVGRLLSGAVELLRTLGASTVNLNAGNAHPWNSLFQRAGFQRREGSPIVAAVSAGASVAIPDFEKNWFVMRGERDS